MYRCGMAIRSTMTVSVTPELKAFVAGRLASGRYANASEVIRAALRLMELNEPDLKEARRRPAHGTAGAR